jgi:hypothetical protein
MYIPNNSTNKSKVWELLKDEIPKGGNLILCGDLNIVEAKRINPLCVII